MGWRFSAVGNNPATILKYNRTLFTWCHSKDLSFLADFIIGSPLRKWARDHRLLRDTLWRIDFVLFWTLTKLAKSLPADVASSLGALLGRCLYPLLRKKSAIIRANLSTAFPEKSSGEINRLVRRAWGRVGRVLMEYPHLGTILEDDTRLTIDVREPIETYKNPSRPCVIVTAHQSNWEVVCSAMARMKIPNASLYSPPTNPLLDRLLMEQRRALNCELLPREHATRKLVQAFKRGRTAAMVMDRRVSQGGAPIQFFGHKKPSTLLPARLALKFGCDLVPVQIVRRKNARFRAIFHPPVKPINAGDDETMQAINMTQQVHQQFEAWIRQVPEDWFCSKRIWPKGKIAS